MAWMKATVAAKKHEIRVSQIHSARLQDTIPKWMEKRGQHWWVDDEANGFLLHLKSKTKKALSAKVGHARAKRKKDLEKKEVNVLTMSETEKLQELSIQAELSKPITNLRLEKYKIEQQKLKLEQQSGELISRAMAEFLYTGYLDRMNRELLYVQNKLEADFEQVIAHLIVKILEGEKIEAVDVAKEMKKMIVNEMEDVIRNVKSDQTKELTKWAEEEGVHL